MANDATNTGPDPARAAVTANPPQQIIIQQPPSMFGRFGKLLTTALLIAIFIIFAMVGSYRNYFGLSDLPKEKYDSLSQTATKKIAIIKVSGLITESDGFVKKQID